MSLMQDRVASVLSACSSAKKRERILIFLLTNRVFGNIILT